METKQLLGWRVDSSLIRRLKVLAKRERRSAVQQLEAILESVLVSIEDPAAVAPAARESAKAETAAMAFRQHVNSDAIVTRVTEMLERHRLANGKE